MTFDPFTDRTARDIRNSLSSALVREITEPGDGQIEAVADRWLARPLAEDHRRYIKKCGERYRLVLAEIRARDLHAIHQHAVALWNAGLYFELHELLETIWPDAPEPEHTALKGWIQAAGAYLHSERGQPAAALAFIVNLDRLIEALDLPTPPPLRLEVDATRLPPG